MPGFGTSNHTPGNSGRLRTALLSTQPRWRGRRVPLDRALAEAEEDVLKELEPIRLNLSKAMGPLEPDGASLGRAIAAAHADTGARRSVIEGGIAALVSRRGASAEDLRQTMALMTILDLTDRMMAQCVSIVTMRNLMRRAEEPANLDLLGCLTAMGELADEQIVAAGRVFATRDLVGLTELRNRDRRLCSLNRTCLALAGQEPSGNGSRNGTRNGSNLATRVARAIERSGEGALAIGRQAPIVAAGIAPPALKPEPHEA